MKLVAARDFANVKPLSIKQEPGPLRGHIAKGTRFEIGTAEKSEDLEPSDKEKVLRLYYAKCIVEASDTKSVAKIDAEVVLEKKRDERAAPVGSDDLVAKIVAAVAALNKPVVAPAR